MSSSTTAITSAMAGISAPSGSKTSEAIVSASGTALFACTKCNGRYPFEELSHSQQLCKDCRGSLRSVKCTYCRTEFQQESKSNVQTICKKCESNVKQFGRPTTCEYCNIIAAFIGNKCQRCTNSEKKYGPPQDCEMCKQRCAFDRKDPESSKKLDGKLLCWLCTISMKRALAKAKQNDASIRHTNLTHKSSSSSSATAAKAHHSHQRTGSGTTGKSSRESNLLLGLASSGSSASSREVKRQRLDSKSNGSKMDTSQSEALGMRAAAGDQFNVVAMSQLKEQVLGLQKQIQKKDQELLDKDKKIAELNALMKREEREWREKLLNMDKKLAEKSDSYQQKIQMLQKQNASLSKQSKKSNNRTQDSPSDSPLL